MTRDPEAERRLAEAAQRVVDTSPEAAEVEVFDHARGTGFVIKWSLPGVGFGEFTVWKSAETGAWSVDAEAISAAVAARVFATAFPQGATTALDLQNLGTQLTVDALAKAFDDIDRTGIGPVGRFGSAGMNTLVDRYLRRAPQIDG